MKPLNEWSFLEFHSAIASAVKDKQNWNYSKTKTAYYADYRPKAPKKTAADFTIMLDFDHAKPRLNIYADTALIPIIKQFSCMQDLITELRNM